MTYSAIESSVESGQPVEVYKFAIGATEYRYTSAEDTVTVSGQDYAPLALGRGKFLQSSEERDGVVDLEVPGNNDFARLYINVIPARPASLQVMRFHRTDGGSPEVVDVFRGFVQSVRFTNDGRVAHISARPQIAVSSRPLLRFFYQGGCNNVLYDEFCQVDETDSAFRATGLSITGVSSDGKTITVDGLSTAYPTTEFFVGGFIEVLSPNDLRLIISQSGDDLTVLMPFHADVLGEQVNVFAGCDRTVSDCVDVFSNFINYGGEPYIGSNPFEDGVD